MKKIKLLILGKEGILKKFLFYNKKIKLGEKIAFIENKNYKFIIISLMNGIIINTIKEGTKINNKDAIANFLTTENEIKKYYLKCVKNNNFFNKNKKENYLENKINNTFYSKLNYLKILKNKQYFFNKKKIYFFQMILNYLLIIKK